MHSIVIPEHFLTVHYEGSRFPSSAESPSLDGGANCQLFAYELLRHFGYTVPDLRSSDLWNDTRWTMNAKRLRPFDLLLFNRTEDPWGAHVAVYLGEGEAIHLSKKVGVPIIWNLERFAQESQYSVFVGAKRLKRRPRDRKDHRTLASK